MAGIENVELISMLGFDYIFLDCEHSTISVKEAAVAYTAATLRNTPVVTRLGTR